MISLTSFTGETVTVWVGVGEVRNSFDSQISVTGTLEQHPETQQYRILTADRMGFVYFYAKNIIEMLDRRARPSQEGAVCTVKIELPFTQETT